MTIEFNPEIRNRIKLSVAAYAYEFENDQILTDAEFDQLARIIDPSIDTNHPEMDQFFREVFDPDTGVWVQSHPEKHKLKRIYKLLTEDNALQDLRYNRDVFAPMIKVVRSSKTAVENPCSRCGKDFMKSPTDGGCHC